MNSMMANTGVATQDGFLGKQIFQRVSESAPRSQNYTIECETIRSWLADNCQGVTGEVSPVFHMQDGVVRRIEMESRRTIFKK